MTQVMKFTWMAKIEDSINFLHDLANCNRIFNGFLAILFFEQHNKSFIYHKEGLGKMT